MKRKTGLKDFPDQPVLLTGIAGRCPRCGKGKVFKSGLLPNDKCTACDLDLKFAEVGDGPAVLVILLLGPIIMMMALLLENTFSPPVWVHIVVWIPVTIVLSFLGLRAMKGIMIVMQYKTMIREK